MSVRSKQFAKTAAAYVRVSSPSQNAAMQREAIRRASEARGEPIGELWFEEKRSAKTTEGRPVLAHVRKLAREGHLTRLYVWKLDRLSRGGFRETIDLIEELRRYGCIVVSVVDGFDIDALLSLPGPIGQMLIAFIAWGAQMELQAITERRIAARERVLAAGGTWGRPRRMSEEQVEKAKAMRLSGSTNRQIAAALGIPRATVARAVAQKSGPKWGERAKSKVRLRRLKKQGVRVDLRKTRANGSLPSSQ